MLIVAVMGISVFTATASASNAVTKGEISQDTVANISTVQKLNKDTATTSKTLYLKPNANWIKSDARFAMYVTGKSGSQWVSMTDLEDGYYSANVPAGDYTAVQFARMNPKSEANTDANKWNYSSKMTIPTDKTNCFTIEAGQWNDATGEWSVYVSKASLKKLYLKPNANWIKTDARFAMYVTGANGAEWVSMEDACDGYYTAYVPSTDYTTVQFARMSGSSSANTLINRWNYSSSMTIPAKSSTTNCYTIDDGQWNNVAGSWGVFTPTVYKADALYLKPNLNWTYNKDGKAPRFSAYLYGGTSPAKWVSMTKVEDGNYRAIIPEGDYPKVQFVRMNPNTTANNWENLWNDSAEMEIPTNGTNRFVIGDNEWSSALGEWDSITELETLYLKPNDNWKRGDARFSIYLYGGSSASKWVSMTGVGDGTYKADIPEGHYTKVIFVRMNPATTENKWDYNWNESTPQRIPVNVTDKFTINANEWNSATGVWSAYNSEEDPTPSEFTVVFKDYNGTVLKTETVQAGKSATAPSAPQRDGYIFLKWNKSFDKVTSDLVVTAVYSKISNPTIFIGNISAKAGETVTVPVTVYNNPGINGIQLNIEYDSKLKLNKAENGTAFSTLIFTLPGAYENPSKFLWDGMIENEVGNGTALTLTFEVPANAKAGDKYAILPAYPNGTIYDVDLNDVNFDTIGGSITVK
jgi:hypothetical protein